MFGKASRVYWTAVLKAQPEQLHLKAMANPQLYWTLSPQHGLDHSLHSGRAIDYGLDAGQVVPQRLWQPMYRRIQEVLVDDSRLCLPIFFVVQATGRVGLPLSGALTSHQLLRDHDQVVDFGGKITTHIRILVSHIPPFMASK